MVGRLAVSVAGVALAVPAPAQRAQGWAAG